MKPAPITSITSSGTPKDSNLYPLAHLASATTSSRSSNSYFVNKLSKVGLFLAFKEQALAGVCRNSSGGKDGAIKVLFRFETNLSRGVILTSK